MTETVIRPRSPETKRVAGKIFVFCQPFVDQTYQCHEGHQKLLDCFKLTPNGSVLFAPDRFKEFDSALQDAVSSTCVPSGHGCVANGVGRKVRESAGGSGLNTARGANLLVPGRVKFFGTLGNDSYGQVVCDQLRRDQLDCLLHRCEDGHTATCVVLIGPNGRNRSMVSTLGCSMQIPAPFVDEIHLDECSIFYLCAYMLDAPKLVLHRLLERLQDSKHEHISLFFNLSAPFCLANTLLIEQILPRVDVLFGNEEEAHAFYRKFSSSQEHPSLPEIVAFMARYGTAAQSCDRVAIVTRGCEPTLAYWDGVVHEIPLSSLYPSRPVLDTTGGGDCFAAGFMANYLDQMYQANDGPVDYAKCVTRGHEFAEFIVKVIGIDFDQYPMAATA